MTSVNPAQKSFRVCVVGSGYVGLTTGACLAFLGHRITCIDQNTCKIEAMKRGETGIFEPGLDKLLRLAAGNIAFTTSGETDLEQADVVILAVGTPSLPDGRVELSQVREAADKIGKHLTGDRYQVVAVKSTVPAGTGIIVKDLLRKASGRKGSTSFAVASNPEFLREGSAVQDMLYPDRIVIGVEERAAAETLAALYRPVLDQEFVPPPFCPRPGGYGFPALITSDITTAEMIKYAANAFLVTKIGFINEIAGLCDHTGADVTAVARAIGLDHRIGQHFLRAGIGWGGSCFGKDTAALLNMGSEFACDLPVLRGAVEVNRRQRLRAVEKLQHALKGVRGCTIGLLGLAFKPNTDDLRDAPALDIARRLLSMGARVKAYDPVTMNNCRTLYPDLEIEYAEDVISLAEGCDALVLVTEWEEFTHLPLASMAAVMNRRVLVDGRNALDPPEVQKEGFVYLGFGRGTGEKFEGDILVQREHK